MQQTIKWEAERKEMLERFIAAWDRYEDGKDPEELKGTTGALVTAHIAASLYRNWELVRDWDRSETKSMERLVKASNEYNSSVDDPEVEKEIKIALDELALAHMAATFEYERACKVVVRGSAEISDLQLVNSRSID